MERIRRALAGLGVLVLAAVSTILAGALAIGRSDLGRVPPGTLGNAADQLGRIRARRGPERLRIGFMGDGQGTSTSRHLLEALAGEQPDLVVLLGDAVRSPAEGLHRLLAVQVEAALPGVPVLYVPGNRDVSAEGGGFDRAAFERRYGASRFVFQVGETLIVGLGVVEPWEDEASELAFLESELARPRTGVARRLVFSHFAPRVTVAQGEYALPEAGGARMLAICREHRVDYLVAGHFHGYARAQQGPTRILVTGGAGGHLHSQRHGHFHHAVVLDLGPEGDEERLLAVPATFERDVLFLGNLLGRVYPVLEGWLG